MKKFWSIFTVALVALSAVSCSNNFEEEVVLGGETLSFNVNIDNTRTALEQGENGWNTVWVGDETLVVSDGTNSYSFKNTDKNKNTFTCAADGVLSLVGKSVEVVYNPVINSVAGAAGMTLAGAAKEFGADSAVELSAGNAFLKLTSTADVTLTASKNIFGDGSARLNSVTIKGENVLVPIYAATDVDFSASFAGVVAKQATLTFVNNKIYNLGTLEAPVASKVWGIAGSHNDWAAGNPASMYEKGDYVVAYNLAGGTQFKFVKLGAGNGGWDGAVGGTYGTNEAPTVSKANTWHSCGETNILLPSTGAYDVYYLPTSMKYNVVAAGSTPEEYVAPKVTLSLSGTFNNWGDTDLVEQNGIYVAKSVKLDAYASFKIRRDHDWAESYGGGIVYMNPNHYIQTYNNGSDISITAADTYDVYFNYDSKLLYVVTDGTDYTKVSKQTAEGKEPVQEEPEVTDKTLYLKPNANWKQSNARFAAYFFGGVEKWVSMTDADKDGIYEVNIPEGYDYGCNVIFCRMNPSTTANNWNNKWNQTSDLKAPTDGKNLYTVKAGTWDKGGGTWSVKQ